MGLFKPATPPKETLVSRPINVLIIGLDSDTQAVVKEVISKYGISTPDSSPTTVVKAEEMIESGDYDLVICSSSSTLSSPGDLSLAINKARNKKIPVFEVHVAGETTALMKEKLEQRLKIQITV